MRSNCGWWAWSKRRDSSSPPATIVHRKKESGLQTASHIACRGSWTVSLPASEIDMQLTPREFDKLLIYMMAEVALKRKTKGLKLNYPEAVAVISAVALDGARAGKTIEEVTKDARSALTKKDVMDGVADLVPMVQIEAVFTDGSRLVTVHTPIQ